VKPAPKTKGIMIREAQAKDAERIAELSTQLGYPSSTVQVTRRLAGLPRDGRHAVYVAETDGRVVGWTHVGLSLLLEADLQAEVHALVVDEAFRGLSIGAALMEQAEQWAREQNCIAVRLRSNVIRGRAHKFYERIGYSMIKTQKAFRKEL
jgi:GNAT superfamily N-acetyltransferase